MPEKDFVAWVACVALKTNKNEGHREDDFRKRFHPFCVTSSYVHPLSLQRKLIQFFMFYLSFKFWFAMLVSLYCSSQSQGPEVDVSGRIANDFITCKSSWISVLPNRCFNLTVLVDLFCSCVLSSLLTDGVLGRQIIFPGISWCSRLQSITNWMA